MTQALPLGLAALVAYLTLPNLVDAATSFLAGALDVSSPIIWLIGGIVVGGIISASRTRSTGRASK
jgi:hypothetical protein